MKGLRLLATAIVLAAFTAIASAGELPRRVALVIGNGAYTAVPALTNPPTDADAIGQALRDVGFTKVTVLKDLSHQGLFDALRAFSSESADADWSVLYYAGHGIEVDGKNYLVPVDAHLAVDRDVDFEGVSMQVVLAAVGGAKQLRLVILDACRDDPFLTKMKRTDSTRSVGSRGLARTEPEGDLYVVYSAKSGQVALDGSGGRSPFVAALLKNIETPGLEVNLLFRKVHADVEQATDGRQEPSFEGTLPDQEMYFRSSGTAPPSPAPAPVVAVTPPPPRPVIAAAPQPESAPVAPIAPPEPPITAPVARPPLPRVASLPPQPAPRQSWAYVTGLDPNGDNFLALKTAPFIGAERIMKMGPRTLLSVTGHSGPWLRVQLRNGPSGWAYGRYITCCVTTD